jgi:hypothetical protein
MNLYFLFKLMMRLRWSIFGVSMASLYTKVLTYKFQNLNIKLNIPGSPVTTN